MPSTIREFYRSNFPYLLTQVWWPQWPPAHYQQSYRNCDFCSVLTVGGLYFSNGWEMFSSSSECEQQICNRLQPGLINIFVSFYSCSNSCLVIFLPFPFYVLVCLLKSMTEGLERYNETKMLYSNNLKFDHGMCHALTKAVIINQRW